MVIELSKFVVSWSGGKESTLSLYKALSQGVTVSYLMSFVSSIGRSMSHAIKVELLEAQSEALEIPIVMREVTWETYERGFKELVNELKAKGVDGCIFGDVWIEEHKKWTERVCKELGIRGLSPLFDADPVDLFKEFIGLGFEALVIMVKKEFMGDEWLGRKLDEDFLNEILELKNEKNIDVLGEMGEYHTFVYDGPIFKKRVEITRTQKTSRENFIYLDITDFRLEKK
ncbi:MAG: diphthine--ammonia ligase [Candidatus Jordarchaeum sp.]|uniref:Dph6-related ATP pyrophosphatase n=1 Tax=Candidatus Jordarchaeum sp. TaxID=2823881 RepID=UPI004049AEE5